MSTAPRFSRRRLLTAAGLGAGLGAASWWFGRNYFTASGERRGLMTADGKRMPVLFVGHGNPMNAIADNAFTKRLAALGAEIPRPKGILCVSAHWMTEGSWVTRMPHPKTIHDFYGFPDELFAVQYPAPGSPAFADLIRGAVTDPQVHADEEAWGLDHGTWSVLKHMYPKADVPVVQLSLYMEQPPEYHFLLGQQLRKLRDQGILIVGSGNIVHNLRRINFSDSAPAFDWAVEFDAWVKSKLTERDFDSLIRNATDSAIGKLSIPSPDHWYPFLYTIGAADADDVMRFEYEGIENSSISMRCVSFGLA